MERNDTARERIETVKGDTHDPLVEAGHRLQTEGAERDRRTAEDRSKRELRDGEGI
ncbi:MAG: hypothetical protein NVS3B7_16280 [Candidatus Elarobacter sp.]